jgi:hypothetical protein
VLIDVTVDSSSADAHPAAYITNENMLSAIITFAERVTATVLVGGLPIEVAVHQQEESP